MLAARLVRRMREQAHFLFVCLEEKGSLGEELDKEGFQVEVLGRKPGLDWRCALRLRRLLRRERVDIVQAHQYTPFSYALLSRIPFRRPPILFTEHGRHQPDYPRRKRMLFNRLMIGRADRLVAVGEAVRQALVVNEGLPEKRIQVIYNGIDASRFADHHDRAAVRAELGLAENDFAIIQVARLDYLKDHATAIRSLARVVRAAPSARLLLVGEGPEEPGIRALVEQLGLQTAVRFLGLRKDVARLLQSADVFLLTSTSEGIPLTVIEAMCSRLPVVCTRVGGTAEVILEGQTGFLPAARDDAGIADALVRLHADSTMRQRFGEAGRERAVTHFSEAGMAERYLALYTEMCHG